MAIWRRSRSLLPLALALGATPLSAQRQGPPPSQAGSVSQSIHTTTVSVHYHRPVARGRDLFGGIVAWGEAWTPGANRATYIELSHDIRIQGQRLPAGNYSLWLIPRERSAWTVIFSEAWDMFHLPYPEGQDRLRFGVRPTEGAHMETLAIYFPVVEGYEATMNIHWGSTILPLRIEVVQR